MIDKEEADNPAFRKAAAKFLKHAQDTINPSVTAADVREMLIQHILTEEIFSQVFDNADFHRQNNVAKELYTLENTFFTGKVKHDTLAGLRSYYAAIKSAAALVSSHHEKQTFLKVIYAQRPPIGSVSFTRQTRSCASWSRALTGSAWNTSANR